MSNPNQLSGTTLILSILLMGAIIYFTRAFPFLVFGKDRRPNRMVLYLGGVLPPAIIALLVVYCLKEVGITTFPYGLPEAIAGIVVWMLHAWKGSALISIAGGTALYMVLIQVVFV